MMTLEELASREAIRDTMARYTMAGDRLRLEDFLAVFTVDAILESEDVPEEDRFRYVGREDIARWMSRWSDRARDADAPTHAASFVRHHLATCQIQLTAVDRGQARTYWTAYTDIGPDHCGYYLDKFRCEEGQWLISHRRVRLDWRSPDSLFGSAIARTR